MPTRNRRIPMTSTAAGLIFARRSCSVSANARSVRTRFGAFAGRTPWIKAPSYLSPRWRSCSSRSSWPSGNPWVPSPSSSPTRAACGDCFKFASILRHYHAAVAALAPPDSPTLHIAFAPPRRHPPRRGFVVRPLRATRPDRPARRVVSRGSPAGSAPQFMTMFLIYEAPKD